MRQAILGLTNRVVPSEAAGRWIVAESLGSRNRFERQALRRHVPARIDSVGRYARAPQRLHHHAERTIVKAGAVGAVGFARRQRTIEHASQILADSLRHEHEGFSPRIVRTKNARGILERLVLGHVVEELLVPDLLGLADRIESGHGVLFWIAPGRRLIVSRLMRPPHRLPSAQRVDCGQELGAILGHLGVAVRAREEHRHRRLRSELRDDLARDVLGALGSALVDVQIVDDHHDQPVGPRGLIVADVEPDRPRQERRRRRVARALVRHLFEGRDGLRLVAVEHGEVRRFQPADMLPVLVHDHDVDLNELDARAEGGLLRGLSRQGAERQTGSRENAQRMDRPTSAPAPERRQTGTMRTRRWTRRIRDRPINTCLRDRRELRARRAASSCPRKLPTAAQTRSHGASRPCGSPRSARPAPWWPDACRSLRIARSARRRISRGSSRSPTARR